MLDIAANLVPSPRGELEITDLNRLYLEDGRLHVEVLGRGFAWLDAGTHRSLLEASGFVEAIEEPVRGRSRMCSGGWSRELSRRSGDGVRRRVTNGRPW